MPIELAAMTASRLRGLPRKQTVFFFPVAPLEDHGPHLPLGQDLNEARWLCQTAAERLETEQAGWIGVVMPSAPLGLEANTSDIIITVRAHVLRDWLVDACRSLNRQGFVHFVCFTGHLGPKQLTAIEEAGQLIAARSSLRKLAHALPALFGSTPGATATLVSADSGIIPVSEVRRSPLWPDAIEHGGARDTSVALMLDAASVDPSYANLPAQEREPSRIARLASRLSRHQSGYWGDPSKAQPEFGQKALQARLDEVFPKLRAVWSGASANMLFRSWYSILPPNKSFFKAWIIALATVAIVIFAFALGGGPG